MLTVQVLASFTLNLGAHPLPACRPGDILVLDDAMAQGLIEKRLAAQVSIPAPETTWTEAPDGTGEDLGTVKPRRSTASRKKADENGTPAVPEADGEQG